MNIVNTTTIICPQCHKKQIEHDVREDWVYSATHTCRDCQHEYIATKANISKEQWQVIE